SSFDLAIESRFAPAFALRLERRLLSRLGGLRFAANAAEEFVILTKAELFFGDQRMVFAMQEVISHAKQFLGLDRIKANLIEEAEEPGGAGFELFRGAPGVPHLHGAADELIASRAFHAVDTQIRATNADGIFSSPRARGIVLCGDQTVTRIDRR